MNSITSNSKVKSVREPLTVRQASCQHHMPNKIECQTRLKLIEKGVYCGENSEFLWETAFYRITDNLRSRNKIALRNLLQASFEMYGSERDACQQAHAIHCLVANYLNFRQSFFGFYT